MPQGSHGAIAQVRGLAARSLLAVLLAALVLGTLALAAPGEARADATIVSATVENGYPKSLTFKLSAKADAQITDATLSYSIVGRGTSALGKPEGFTPGTSIDTQVVVQVNSGASYIPVGSAFAWHWEITTADGKTTTGPEASFFFLPPGKEWKSVKGDFMAVYYHGDKEALASAFLKAGLDTYKKVGQDLLAVTLKQVPVNVILFDDEKEMDPARPGSGGRFDAAVTTCGTKVTNDIVLVIPVSCGTPDRTDTLRHEFGHILNQAAGEGPLGKLPSWLDEGTAVIAQSTPGSNYTGAFDSAARAGRLIPFSQMGTPSSDAGQVNLFYGQSYEMALYLVEKGGPAKYAEFFATIKKGSRFDDALKRVYGFDLAGFEKEFLAANGAQPRVPTATPTARPQRQQQATPAPTTRPASAPTTRPASVPGLVDDGGDSGISTVPVVAVGAAILFALIAVFLYLLSMMMSSNRKKATGAGPDEPNDWSRRN